MKNNFANILKSLSLISYIGIMMITPIVGSVYIWNELDQRFRNNYTMLIFILLGVGAAFLNVYKITMKNIKKKK